MAVSDPADKPLWITLVSVVAAIGLAIAVGWFLFAVFFSAASLWGGRSIGEATLFVVFNLLTPLVLTSFAVGRARSYRERLMPFHAALCAVLAVASTPASIVIMNRGFLF